MRYLLLILLIVMFPSLWAGDVYKWVDAEGNTHYGDQPDAAHARKIELPGLSHYEPPPIKQAEETEAVAPTEAMAPSEAVSDEQPGKLPGQDSPPDYRELKIIKPEPEGTLRNNEGLVDVFLALAPVLAKEHYVKVEVDGKAIPGHYTTTVIRLANIERGEHTVRVAVYDKAGVKLIESETVTFYLQKASVLNRPQPR